MNKRAIRLVVAGWMIAGFGAFQARSAESKPVFGEFVRLWQVCGPFASTSLLDPVLEGEGSVSPASHPLIG